MTNLVEFPDDKVAFAPESVTSIVGEKRDPIYICLSHDYTKEFGECPGKLDSYYGGTICTNPDHSIREQYTLVTVGGKELFVRRPFDEVMLAITATLLENKTNPTVPENRKYDFFSRYVPKPPPIKEKPQPIVIWNVDKEW